jgi:hypothetical protein
MGIRASTIAATVCVMAALVFLSACGASGQMQGDSLTPGPPIIPAQADLSTPESAVSSYIEWVSYSYRTADSDVSSHTMTLGEGVRVDAYIELNRQQDRAIEQEIVGFDAPPASIAGTEAVVVAEEEWRYRYITMSTGAYDGPLREVSYDATYTLVLEGDRWLVDLVEATPLSALE